MRNNYKPRPSSYVLAHRALIEEYTRMGNVPLSIEQAERKLKCTPGIRFSEGTTLEDVFKTLSIWRLVFRGKVAGLGERIIPLEG